MNKDLSKEYKEAVMNDLPDLWGRIEAAIDAEENAKTDGNETPASNVINFNKPENNTVNTANKYAVNAYDNEPVKAQTQKKKKFRIPAWVFVAVPSAAILLLVIIPVGFMMMLGGMGSKMSAPTTTANYACDASPAATTTTAEAATDYYDAAATWDEPAVSESTEYYEEDSTQEYKNAVSDYDYTLGQDKLEGLQGLMENFDGTKSDSATSLAPTEREADSRVINDGVKIKFLSVYENDEGKKMADVEIVGVYGGYFEAPEGFDGFEKGETITAYLKPDFKDVDFTEDAEYDCIINYVPDDEICYEIELKKPSRTED
ncbi:MAG: hypothetical protein IKS60_03230 [Lachnospiraceae bacterium]|nr:hypothetical protein [Lachnospiraceae bacterium]MBR4412601.1 hypothetical protein [Lachnospiraceae bacterium]